MAKIIFLIGYMGSGKSTWGKRLANRLQWDFVDMDAQLEQKFGVTINQYFEEEGEEGFRKEERDWLRGWKPEQNTVVAAGGGTPCFHENMSWMNEQGTTIYFEANFNQLFSRLLNDRGDRPMLRDFPKERLQVKILNHLNAREPYYKQARLSIDAFNLNAARIQGLIERLQEIDAL